MSDVVSTGLLSDASVVAGAAGMERPVSWVHIVELPEPGPWISRDQLLLTTGFAWPPLPTAIRSLIRELDGRGVAGIALAVPSYLVEFPQEARQEADRLGLPLLQIPWELPFAEISESLNRAIISEQLRHRDQAHAIHRSLTRSSIEANSLEEIVSEFSRLIRRTVVVEDVDGNVIAAHAGPNVQAFGMPASAENEEMPTESLIQLVGSGYWASIKNSRSATRIPWTTPLGSGTAVVCPVWLKQELAALLWIPDGTERLDSMVVQSAEHAATVIALYIAHDRAVVDVERRLRYTLIDSLLEGQFTGDALGLERATLMGFDPTGEYKVAIFVLPESTPLSRSGYLRREQFVDRVARRMTQRGYAPLISPSLNQVSILVPPDTRLEAISERLLLEGVSASVGRIHSGIEGVRRSYLEARSMIGWSQPNVVTEYDDVLLPRLLNGDKDARLQFMTDMLKPFQSVLHADIYMETLRELATCGFIQKQASTRLNIHPKTMQYRVAKIENILKMDLSQPDDRFRVQLLYRLLDSGSHGPGPSSYDSQTR